MADDKVPVIVTFSSPGTKPPVYVAGEFTDWQPEEMEYSTEAEEHHFHKQFMLKSGARFQYKFRLGPGDWWVLNENAPVGEFSVPSVSAKFRILIMLTFGNVATDDAGNRNNLLTAPDHAEADQSKLAAEEIPRIPILVVEKTNDKNVYGDDFGSAATSAQRDAHAKRAADAEPDLLLVGHSAEVAAEVADTAAVLDKEHSPVRASDIEAGRTGDSRTSTTPILEVANTASEVADSAAKLDGEVSSLHKHLSHADLAGHPRPTTRSH